MPNHMIGRDGLQRRHPVHCEVPHESVYLIDRHTGNPVAGQFLVVFDALTRLICVVQLLADADSTDNASLCKAHEAV